jgi:hypothetical protein
MNIEKNEAFELAFSFITETAESIFLTGKAGTGKTTFLKYLKDNCSKNIVVAAPTGVAAINAGGVTLHSLFQLPFHPFLPTQPSRDDLLRKLKFNNQRLNLLRKMEVLVIDEISMVRADTLDAIDCILRNVRRNYEYPFGGVQLLFIGDLFQLPPVAQQHEWSVLQEYYSSPYFFDSLGIKEQQPLLIELNKIYRQKEDSFVALLNKVRNNKMSADDFEILNERYIPAFSAPYGGEYITLTSHNKQADIINNTEIEKLLTPAFVFNAEVEGDFPESMYPAEAALLLKVGTQVMFLKNDNVDKKYFNGKIGVVTELSEDKVIVTCDGTEIPVSRDNWENKKYTLNRTDGKLEQEVVGVFTQFPLRLAWAITIHKSQGLTFNKVMIDAASAFSSGQVYVALSRCTSLEGIVLLSKIPASAIQNNEQVAKGQKDLTHKGSLAERFVGARQLYTLQILEELFNLNNPWQAVHQLKQTIFKDYLKLNNGAINWMEDYAKALEIDKINGDKFVRHIQTMLKDEPTIEKNEALQKRLTDAANHFLPRITELLNQLKLHPLVTEHKEIADKVNEFLNEAALALHGSCHYIAYCKNNFTLQGYLQHRLNYATPKFNISCYGNKKISNVDAPNAPLYTTLKSWRDAICDDEDLPIYMVASHTMLKDICTYLPRTKSELILISGFGKAKVDKYGDEILDAVLNYCEEHNIAGKEIVVTKSTKKKKTETAVRPVKENTKQISYDLYKAGKSIEEIAQTRNFTTGTIEGHLAHYIETGELKIETFLSKERVEKVSKALSENMEANATDIVLANPDISYSEIRFVRAHLSLVKGKE